jgi:hypothetical protein
MGFYESKITILPACGYRKMNGCVASARTEAQQSNETVSDQA